MRLRFAGSIAILAAACLPILFAQATEQSATTTASAEVPARSLAGVWVAEGGDGPAALLTNAGELPAMTAWGEAQFKEAKAIPQKIADQNAAGNDPHLRCDPPGVPRVYLFGGPVEFIQTSNRLFIFYEEGHYWREIWMDGRALPKDPDPRYMGYSVGRWQDDMLIIDTIGFNDKTWLDHVGHPHSEALHVVERITRIDGDTLQITFLFDDPKAYDKPWSAVPRILKLTPARELVESFCVPGDSHVFEKENNVPDAVRK